ncbi:ABC transporter substrate-binding protein [Pseudodesulfovibrio tunisiensis]|uniref:ABC transporter substrate-binding protein n=1 Tax=Pseudodesulfovibrio tunisiensis TaxID=463192 RepID=UPI001FB4216C|nr:extracellular solute-binding protein [Pseudodesulfovibrio tunisiensis]
MKKLALTVLVLALFAAAGPAIAAERVVHVFNWTEYIPEGVIEEFEATTGIKVVYATFESNESMYAKLKMLDGKGYDVIVPSTYFVSKMAREGLLRELDHAKLPNLKNMDPAYLDKPFDKGNRYSMPYAIGGTGIMVNRTEVNPERIRSWKGLWDSSLAGQILLMDDMRDVFGIALKINGHSLNDTDPKHIEQAYELLKSLMPNVRTFNSDTPKTPFLNEEVGVGMIWNGEAFVAMNEMDTLEFIWPEEGGLFWMDCLCIPAGAENVDEAHEFINFILRPEVARQMVEEWGYATANRATIDMLPENYRKSSVIFPPKEVMDKSEFQNDVGEAIFVYEKFWNRLKGGH